METIEDRNLYKKQYGLKKYQPVGTDMTRSRSLLGLAMRTRRIKLNMSQNRLGQTVGLSQGAISNIELGRGPTYLTPENLEKIASALGFDLDFIKTLLPVKPTRSIFRPNTRLGRLVSSRLKLLNLSDEEFAKLMGLNIQMARTFVRKSGLHYRYIVPLSKALDIKPEILLKFVVKNESQPKDRLGREVRKRRKELLMSQDILAGRIGVTKQFISAIERGEETLERSETLINKIADELNLNPYYLLRLRCSDLKRKKTELVK